SLAAAASSNASSCSDSPSLADFKALFSFFISLRVKVSWKNGTSILVPLADSKVNFSTDMWGLLNKIGYKNGWSRKNKAFRAAADPTEYCGPSLSPTL